MKWNYYKPKFEYENIFNDFDWAWAGHKFFAYDFIRNFKPKRIVELGTHKGTSFFSFCQAVKDGELDTELNAVDTWKGDKHAGFYGEEIFDEVNVIKKTCYDSLNLNFLRKFFDDALSDFQDGSIELLHIDGLHTYAAVKHDFDTWLPKMSKNGVILLHDISEKTADFGVYKLWAELKEKYSTLEFHHSHGLGICFLNSKIIENLPVFEEIWRNYYELFHDKVVLLNENKWMGLRLNDEQSIARKKEEEMAELKGLVKSKEGEVNMLKAVVKIKEDEVNVLTMAVKEKDVYVKSLEEVVVERDEQVADYQQRENELQALSTELRNEIVAYRSSMSWRVTRPLRGVFQLGKRVFRPISLYQKYRKTNPGVRGCVRLSRLCVDVIRKGGIKELRNAMFFYDKNPLTALPKKNPSRHEVLLLEDVVEKDVALPTDVAVHAHIYYLDLVSEMLSYLANIPVKFHLYVTTDTLEKAKLIEDVFANMENVLGLEVVVSENRGRDILPMLVTLGDKLAQHEIVLHIHTKRSPHNSAFAGWRRYMMESLLGNSQRITAILQQFGQDKYLGILFPDYYHPVKPFVDNISNANDNNMEKLLNLAGKKKEELKNIDRNFFPAGDMFWFRGKAIKPFVEMKLAAQYFEPEEGQVDGTLAHAIERMFIYFAGEVGLIAKAYLPNSFLPQICSAHKIYLLRNYIESGLISNPTIIFDHNFGGGANIYTEQLVKNIQVDGGTVLRIYCSDAVWFVQWIGDCDGMLFCTSSIEDVFAILSVSRSESIIINSLYGFPDIPLVISKIVGLVRTLKATLDVKIHDFYAICPSPHLLNFEGKYCGVPQDLKKCLKCLKKNHGWFHSWYPKKNRPVNITEWRKSFLELFEMANSISVFDQSSIEILSKGFKLGSHKIGVTAHDDDYFKSNNLVSLLGKLHIGVLGTLTIIKGAVVINALAEYIEKQGMGIPITVVGKSLVPMGSGIKVLGSYDNNNLAEVVRREGINVILISSIVPETFSYTISEAMKMGLPIVAFDIGAQGNRVKRYKMGKVISLGSSPEVILAAIQFILKSAKKLKK